MKTVRELIVEHLRSQTGHEPSDEDIAQCSVDIHRLRAASAFKVPMSDVTKEQRAQARAINYSDPVYGYGYSGGVAKFLRDGGRV